MDDNLSSSNFAISKDIIKEYYECMQVACEHSFDGFLKDFAKKYPNEYKHLNAVHRRRVAINKNIDALKELNEKIYFGTLTFNSVKDHNKIESKRKEAFKVLNSLFEFVILVEEKGEENGRYHVHFLGNFIEGKTFDDFTKSWHSRQNLRELRDNERISQYLCKYLSKDLPRIRRNKKLIALEREVSKRKSLKKSFPMLYKRGVQKKIFELSIFDV